MAPKFAKQKVTVKKLETLMKDFIWWSLVQMDFVSLPQLQSCHLEHQEEVYEKNHPDPFANEIKSSQLPQRSR